MSYFFGVRYPSTLRSSSTDIHFQKNNSVAPVQIHLQLPSSDSSISQPKPEISTPSTKAIMSSTPTKTGGAANPQNQKLLEAMIRQIPDKGVDWSKIADELGSTPGAARERWRRYKIANNIGPSNLAVADDAKPASAKKARAPKRKAESVVDDENVNDEGGPSKKKKTTAKKPSNSVKVKKEIDGDGEKAATSGKLELKTMAELQMEKLKAENADEDEGIDSEINSEVGENEPDHAMKNESDDGGCQLEA